MDEVLNLTVLYEKDKYLGYIKNESIEGKTKNNTYIQCDVDNANADDFIKALILGMKLREEGYTCIECNYVDKNAK